jgi:hypothetical protein
VRSSAVTARESVVDVAAIDKLQCNAGVALVLVLLVNLNVGTGRIN